MWRNQVGKLVKGHCRLTYLPTEQNFSVGLCVVGAAVDYIEQFNAKGENEGITTGCILPTGYGVPLPWIQTLLS